MTANVPKLGAVRPWLRCFAALLFAAAAPLRPLAEGPGLPTLTTARAAHELSVKEAARGYPVRLRAVVTYYDPYISPVIPVLMVHDGTGGIFVGLAAKPEQPLHPGDLIEVEGQSGAGNFAPVVDGARVRVVGQAPLPEKAPRVSLTDMLSGSVDGQWVEVEGVVHEANVWRNNVFLTLALTDGEVQAMAVAAPGMDYSQLVDAKVRVRGNASPIWNRQKQMTGAHVLFPGLRSITVEEAAPSDPFALPAERIDDLLRYTPNTKLRHRTRIRGTLTLLWPGRMICVQEGTQGLCAETRQGSTLAVGSSIDVVGFPAVGDYTPTLTQAIYEATGGPAQPVAPKPITPEEAMRGWHDAELVSIEGKLVGHDWTAKDPTLLLASGNMLFSASLARAFVPKGMKDIEEGTVLRLTGVCSIHSDGSGSTTDEGFPVVESFRILQRSMGDVVIVRRPSWWSANHTLRVLAGALLIAIAALGGVAYLRHRVKQQTLTIRTQLAETEALKDAAEFLATHDSLTGLRNRKAIFDCIHREYDLACRSARATGVMMLDLDHFKRINDTCGHGAGDEVLKEAVRRTVDAVRSTDMVGRYGGEEFLVVMPSCTAEEIVACAERIRAAICAAPIAAAGMSLEVTVSIGVVSARFPQHSEEEAIHAADLALYEAKRGGRNRVVVGKLEDGESLQGDYVGAEARRS
jgi:diguanylate cyclase (GGDEF)-like protein